MSKTPEGISKKNIYGESNKWGNATARTKPHAFPSASASFSGFTSKYHGRAGGKKLGIGPNAADLPSAGDGIGRGRVKERNGSWRGRKL